MKKVLFIGPAPQNIGGISIHIRRLVKLLDTDIVPDYVDEGHMRYTGVFNLRSLNLVKYFQKIKQSDVVHIHSGIWMLRAFHMIVCKMIMKKKTVVTIHRDPTIEPLTRMTYRLIKKCDHAILVNKKGFESMKCDAKCQYHLLPAFLPPLIEDEPLLPIAITDWIANARKNENSVVLCSNAWNLVLHEGVDLYGLDLCIESMAKINNGLRKYFLVFVVATNTSEIERMQAYKKMIVEKKLENNILIWEKPTSFVRLVQESDIVLRTTNTDGDAISIREALYLGKPVVASDVVERPEGTFLFQTRNVEDLVKSIQTVENSPFTSTIGNGSDFKQLYLEIYNN